MGILKYFSGERLVHLSMACFVLVSSVGLSLINKKMVVPSSPIAIRAYDISKLPILGETNSFPIISSQGAIAVDMESGVTLYEKNSDQPLLPASTTKILTALTAMDYFPMEAKLKIGRVRVEGQRIGLKEGEEYTFVNLLSGLLIYSGNDAAEVIAANYPGGREIFVTAMNMKAKSLHMDNSYFENPVGFDNYNHISTAKDMVRLARIAMENPIFANIVNTKEVTITDISGKSIFKLENTNKLLGTVFGVKGVKTGWTENARENLVTVIERDGHKVMIAVLGSQDRFGETKELINWIFANYQWKEIKSL